jgi:hypothetical protein
VIACDSLGARMTGGGVAGYGRDRRAGTIVPVWRAGDRVRWNGYTGTFLRDTVDGQAEVLIGTRTYRMHKAEMRSA